MSTDGSDAVRRLEPQRVWEHFAGIAAVPRPSKKEERIRAHVRQVAQSQGLAVREDAAGNVLIEAPATPGCERAAPVLLQGHLDMVCEKNAGTAHDFDRDPIALVVDRAPDSGQPIVRAKGTTLGADNGLGVALALAAATDPDVVHGPLEILCTVDEEAGMTGARALDPSSFKSRRMINLDSEEDDVLYIGCAGGGDVSLRWTLPTTPAGDGREAVHVVVDGLRGGHSGGDIHENRGNANKVLVRTLLWQDSPELRVVTLAGGSLRNALAREASATVVGPGGLLETLRAAAAAVRDQVRAEAGEPNLRIEAAPAEPRAEVASLSPADTRRLLLVLAGLPHGVLEMHTKMPGLVQASNNVATIRAEPLNGGRQLKVEIGCLSRSAVDSRLEETRRQVAAIGRLAGADVAFGRSYPGWAPKLDSPLLATCQRVYAELFGAAPKVTAIHAGLECGIIGRQMEGQLDMVSMGPRITGAHSPDERTYVQSVQKSYTLLKAVLKSLASE